MKVSLTLRGILPKRFLKYDLYITSRLFCTTPFHTKLPHKLTQIINTDVLQPEANDNTITFRTRRDLI